MKSTISETDLYFYHPDHLGSASWITDAGGQAIQHLQYLPFGETKVDQRTTSWNTRYSFSAKEKDEESGYSYFGARYYDSELSIWLSVDPMSDNAPSWTPYNYCFQNPVKLVDPDGNWPWEASNVRQARQYAKATGGHLKIDKTANGKWAIVVTGRDGGVDVKGFKPTNDSWGNKIKNFFKKIGDKMTGGHHGTSDNGQGQETRKGDGSNKSVDLSPLTSSMPEPLNNSSGMGTRENAQENTSIEGTSGVFHIREEVGSWNGGPSSWEYKGTKDSAKKVEQFKKWEKVFNTKYIIKVEVNE